MYSSHVPSLNKSFPRGYNSIQGIPLTGFKDITLGEPIGQLDKHEPIGIGGAGVAGLSAAMQLVKMGYTNIEIFDDRPKVGGKVQSYEYTDGNGETHFYDYGAVGIMASNGWLFPWSDYSYIVERAKHHGLELFEFVNNNRYDTEGNEIHYQLTTQICRAKDFMFYMLNVAMWNIPMSGPTTDLPEDLKMPWNKLVEEKGWQALDEALACFIRGAGYKDEESFNEENKLKDDSTPAYYVIQYVNKYAIPNIVQQGLFGFKDGFQKLWEKEAEELMEHGVKIHTNCPVTGIVRAPENERVRVMTGDGKNHQFRKFLVAFNPRNLVCGDNPILTDCTDVEYNTFNKLNTVRYGAFIGKVEGLPDEENNTTFTTVQNFVGVQDQDHDNDPYYVGSIIGHPTSWSKKDDTGVHVFYVFTGNLSEEEVWNTIEQDVEKMGGQVTKRLSQSICNDYFPHVDTENMDFFPLMESLQGKNHQSRVNKEDLINYCGGALTLETTRASVDNALKVAKEMVNIYD